MMKNEDFKVIPGLSITSKELESRIQNGTISIGNGSGNYSTDPEMTRTLKMTRAELNREFLKGQETIEKLKKSIEQSVEEYKKIQQAETLKSQLEAKQAANTAAIKEAKNG